MECWSMDGAAHDAASQAVAGLFGAVAGARVAAQALQELRRTLGAGSWAVYRVWRDRPPVLHLSAALQDPQCTLRCFAAYRDGGLYAGDRSFEPVRRAPQPLLLRLRAEDAPPAHRDAIYVANGMVDRLSVARTEADGSVLAVNAYRHADCGRFDAADLALFGRLALPLLAAAARQIEWQDGDGGSPREQLRRQAPGLTGRELDVLERLLAGMTYDGIAADLGLSVATVKTYRARAFERLDIHFKHELFARFLGDAARRH
jgi:DNA-binding CsgD family transcriptional regulator